MSSKKRKPLRYLRIDRLANGISAYIVAGSFTYYLLEPLWNNPSSTLILTVPELGPSDVIMICVGAAIRHLFGTITKK